MSRDLRIHDKVRLVNSPGTGRGMGEEEGVACGDGKAPYCSRPSVSMTMAVELTLDE